MPLIRMGRVLLQVVLLCCCAWPPGSRAASQDYQVGPGDELKIVVYQNPDLAADVRVQQGGEVRLRLIDPVRVAGLTAAQIEDLIAEKLKSGNFVLDPRVTVLVTTFRSQQVSVLGYVVKPGLYALEGPTRLSEVLAQAGGVQATAADRVVIQRGAGDQRIRLTVDQSAAFIDGDPHKDISMQAGDIVYVPSAPVYYIKGEVMHPGAGRVERTITVEQALTLAGGLGPRGSERMIQLKRRDPKGVLEIRPAQLDEAVQADDVLTVEVSQFYIYGEVLRPGPYGFNQQITLQQALAMGGGATARGSNRSLRVYRRTAAGAVELLDDPGLGDAVRPDDVIFVKDRLF